MIVSGKIIIFLGHVQAKTDFIPNKGFNYLQDF